MARKRGRRRSPFKLTLPKDTAHSFLSLGFIAFGCLILISFTRQTPFLSSFFDLLSRQFGPAIFFISYISITAGLMMTKLNWKITRPNVFFGSILLFIAFLGLFRGGQIGLQLWFSLSQVIWGAGAFVIFFGLAIAGLILITETTIDEIFLFFSRLFNSLISLPKKFTFPKASYPSSEPIKIKGIDEDDSLKKSPPALTVKKPAPATAKSEFQPLTQSSSASWQYPPLNIFNDKSSAKVDRGDVKTNADTIERTLQSFGIEAKVTEINGGPTVTQYALRIALGTKLSKITVLHTDLALALAAPTGQIRIEAPIPGRSLVGIEIPNHQPEIVNLRRILESKDLKKNSSKLAVGLGLNVSGKVVLADIASMPHVLIAGATGSGKSVCINSFICTMLFRASPSELRMIMVDPKRVELTRYNGIPHLLTPVIVEPKKVIAALQWCIKEMEQRYKTFAEVGARNIESYNQSPGLEHMPYIIFVIDELADIMLYSAREVEDSVTRIAQMARATGIHLILSTQRPSTDVITGLIKANIPCRISFNVTSMIDSRVIIDTPGAEKLLGRGDMLYVPPTQSKPTRLQSAFVSDVEVNQLINFFKKSNIQAEYSEEVTEKYPAKATVSTSKSLAEPDEEGEKDEFFEQAAKIVSQYDRASASLLQRRLSIGYARAARIIDQLHTRGIVGPPDGSKPREVLIKH
jgi:S-DNA-T family DNA segregation ATPase FtsK/SpoIIIE